MSQKLTLEARIQQLEDVEEIRNLKYRYAQHANIINGPGDLESFAALFTEDALWDVGLGMFQGPASILKAMSGVTQQWQRAMHFMINPLITVDGDEATGVWSGLFPLVNQENPRPVWHCLIYDERYVRTTSGWKFSSVTVRSVFEPPEFQQIYESFLAQANSLG